MRVLLFLIFISFILKAEPLHSENCYEKNDADFCNAIAARYRAENKFEDAFKASKKACELMNDFGCSQMQSDSLRFSAEIQNQVFEMLKSHCRKDAKLCGSLASAYEEKKDYANAIVFSKKAFESGVQDSYPYLEYTHGDKATAYKASLKRCEAEPSSCTFYIRYLADNPELKLLVTEAKKYCAQSDKGSSGATSCSVLGTYFESRKNYSESNETWSGACDRKDKMSCSLLIASKQATAVQKEKAYRTICKTKSNFISPRDTDIDRKYCKNRKNFLTLPEGLVKSSQDLLTSFLEEQK